MATITIPDELNAKLAARAASLGFAGVDEYAAAVLLEETFSEDYGAPAHLSFQTREQLEALILEGLASPTIEMTPADWHEMRRRFRESRLAAPSESPSIPHS